MASAKQAKIEASSNWTVSDDKTLYDSITIDNTIPSEIVPLESIVTIESCIQLIKSSDEACTLNFNTSSPTEGIKVLNIVSGAKYVEVYTGDICEYHNTHKGELVDDFEGTIIYKAQITLNTSVSKCSLKLLQCTPPDCVWIYGINIIYIEWDSSLFKKYLKPNQINSDTKPTISASSAENIETKQLCDMGSMFNKFPERILIESMKMYIDSKFNDLEKSISQKFDKIENNQNKLTKLIEELQKAVLSNQHVLEYSNK